MDAVALLLITADQHAIGEPNIEAGFARFRRLVGDEIDLAAFCDAIAACQRDGLIREPVRLPEAALQCHWRLELTEAGRTAARPARRPGPSHDVARKPAGGG
jgi:hypothetical protein